VLRELALHRHIGRATIGACVHGTFRQAFRLMLRAMLARERIVPATAVLVEDSLANLKSARALGVRTVLITRHGTTWRQRYRGTVGLRIASLHELTRRRPR
jgi:putative hydrolase of the HAD superfamily